MGRSPKLGPRLGRTIVASLALALSLLLVSGCAPLTVTPTPTATRTPRPTLTPTPPPTPTPSPTPTPAFPVTAGCAGPMSEGICAQFEARIERDPTHFVWSGQPDADLVITMQEAEGARPIGEWFLVLAAPFFTVDDEVTSADLRATWQGEAKGPFEAHPLLVTTDTVASLVNILGPPSEGMVQMVAGDALLSQAESQQGWAILPFDALVPQWKVLRIDGLSLLERGQDLSTYPLRVPIFLSAPGRADALALALSSGLSLTNRDLSRMTIVAMTGVTAMTRATARLMETKGITYPAKDIKAWFSDADFVHISNEVSFMPDCVPGGSGTLSFCSDDRYIALLEEVNANIIELTGNHLEDKGPEWVDHSLELYRERGWRWFGGGANALEASRPLTLTHHGNTLAFLGCNTVGPFADEESGGAARCDFEEMVSLIRQLREAGYLPIVTLQYLEDYSYAPTPAQIRDFRRLAEAGAVVVQGSQAHQPQTMEFYGSAFIHYGLGNFFFDQMWSDGTRQEFVDRLIFYGGRLISIDLRTAILEEYGRPRPMTVGDPEPAADRRRFLEMIFELRPSATGHTPPGATTAP